VLPTMPLNVQELSMRMLCLCFPARRASGWELLTSKRIMGQGGSVTRSSPRLTQTGSLADYVLYLIFPKRAFWLICVRGELYYPTISRFFSIFRSRKTMYGCKFTCIHFSPGYTVPLKSNLPPLVSREPLKRIFWNKLQAVSLREND